MKINELTQPLTPFFQFKKTECCNPVSSFSLTGPDRDMVSFGMSPVAVGEDLGVSTSKYFVSTFADAIPNDTMGAAIPEVTNPFRKFVNSVKQTNIQDSVAPDEAQTLKELYDAAMLYGHAGF